jgi:hypothetical protein
LPLPVLEFRLIEKAGGGADSADVEEQKAVVQRWPLVQRKSLPDVPDVAPDVVPDVTTGDE